MMNTEQELELVWLFEERTEDPCEHVAHGNDPEWHGGAGEWLIRIERCPVCFRSGAKDVLCCDTYKRLVADTGARQWCGNCRYLGPVKHTVLGRKGVDF